MYKVEIFERESKFRKTFNEELKQKLIFFLIVKCSFCYASNNSYDNSIFIARKNM